MGYTLEQEKIVVEELGANEHPLFSKLISEGYSRLPRSIKKYPGGHTAFLEKLQEYISRLRVGGYA